MIRRRSYTEAVGAGTFDEASGLPCPTPLSHIMKRASYISSSDDSDDGRTDGVCRQPPMGDRVKSFIRSDSIRYYDMRNSREELADPASRMSMQEIFDSCMQYVSEQNLRESGLNDASDKRIPDAQDNVQIRNESVELRIVEDGEMITSLNGEEVIITPDRNEDFDAIEDFDDDSKSGASVFPVTYTGRNSAKKPKKRPEYFGSRAKKPKRVVFKTGKTNVPLRNNIKGKARLFLDDFATTLIEMQWRWLTFYFAACNFIVWLMFAALFYVASYANGDFEGLSDHVNCIENGQTFTGIFTFSVETQVSIGYGEKYPNEECPEVVFIMVMEVVFGYIMIGGMTCVVFAKIIRPEKHIEGVGFSKNVVVCLRDGQLCLVFRAWDCLQKHAIGFQARAWYIKHTYGTAPIIYPLDLGKSPILLWPTTIQHTIDEKSPLFDMSAKDLVDKKFEIIFALTGGDRSTGQMSQSRTSYLPHEVLWGSRFKCAISYNYQERAYVIETKCLNQVDSVDTPLCSARLLNHVNNALREDPTSVSLPGSPLFSPYMSPLSSPNWSFRSRKLNDNQTLNVSLP